MSIIIGLVNEGCGLVASDGRKTSGAKFLDDKIVERAQVIDDNYNKTFELIEKKIIGAVAGLMEIQGIEISKHIANIIETHCENDFSITNIIQNIIANLKIRLESIPSNEIIFDYRKIDLILVTRATDLPQDFNMYAITFKPNTITNTIDIEETISPAIRGNTSWQLFGDDSSRQAVNEFLEQKISELEVANEKSLRSLCYKAIRLGIKTSSINKFGDSATCGGNPFVKYI